MRIASASRLNGGDHARASCRAGFRSCKDRPSRSRRGSAYSVAAPSALIGASNFFELAVTAAISLFGFQSGAVLAIVVWSRFRLCFLSCGSLP